MIKPGLRPQQTGKVWADLGSGQGLFARALASVLAPGSTIHAADRSAQLIERSFNGNSIVFHQLDFNESVLPVPQLDGILMANSLHFVKDKLSLLLRLKRQLSPDGQLLIIEYELESGNRWVPYPIPYATLAALLSDSGFRNISRLSERQSMYGGRTMYACAALNG